MFIRYLLIGFINTLLGVGVILGAREFCSEIASNAIGYLIVVPLSFLLHREFSFRDKGEKLSAFARYLPTILAGYGSNVAALTAALKAGINPYFSQLAAISTYVLVTFFLQRTFVFHSHRERKSIFHCPPTKST
jgi:putative flippase GtrA